MLVRQKPCIVIAGYIVCGPVGGLAWHHLQYVLGFQQLGFDVLFVEDSHDYAACYHPKTFQFSTDPSYGLAFIQAVFEQYGLNKRWAYFDHHKMCWLGKSEAEIKAFAKKADFYINLSGIDPLREHFAHIPVRIYVDTDPVFTQIRHLTDKGAMTIAKAHTHFFSFGENIGKDVCTVPKDGFDWMPTRQPVVMNAWTEMPVGANAKWTTVMQWDSYKVKEFDGKKFGMKSSSFDAYLHLPKHIDDKIELALGSSSAPREKLAAEGWHITDPLPVSLTPQSYQHYIAGSKGEWSVAKEGYVFSNSGWFSERTLNYMASGKPVVVQDTGFSSFLPTGKGLLPFTNLEECIGAIENANVDYAKHSAAAREIVAGYFEAASVLQALLYRL